MGKTKPQVLFLKSEDILVKSKNYKEFDSLTYHKLVNSIALYGQLIPIHVERKKLIDKYEVIAGSNILKALKHLGYSEFMCVVVKDDLQVIDVILNELSFKTNYIELSNKLLESNLERISKHLPFTEDEIEKIRVIASYDWNSIIKKKDDSQISMFDIIEAEEVSKTPEIATEYLQSENVNVEEFVEKGVDEMQNWQKEILEMPIEETNFVEKITNDNCDNNNNIDVSEKIEKQDETIIEFDVKNIEKDTFVFPDDLGKEESIVERPKMLSLSEKIAQQEEAERMRNTQPKGIDWNDVLKDDVEPGNDLFQ